jgi:hypothetical protein
MERIEDVRSITGRGTTALVEDVARARRGAFRVPVATADGPLLAARVNHGRWLVDCPYCSGAELADRDDPRFFCLSCYNAGAGGAWLPVQFPGGREGIESALLERKQAETRNWVPGETVIDLLAQTLERERD